MVSALDPAQVREHLDDLDRERLVQQAVVDHLADLLDSAERTLTALDKRIAQQRAHPAVIEVLAQITEQAAGQRERHPGDPWTWLESVAGGHVLPDLPPGMTLELARDDVSGRVYVAPAGTLPPTGDRWTFARVVTV